MSQFTRLLIFIVGALHVGFAVLEMVLWTEPMGMKIFGNDPEFAQQSAALAMNQGLYNLFLAAGLFWAGITLRKDLSIFFLGCVIVAGVFGAATVSPRIFLIQGLPAVAALIPIFMRR